MTIVSEDLSKRNSLTCSINRNSRKPQIRFSIQRGGELEGGKALGILGILYKQDV